MKYAKRVLAVLLTVVMLFSLVNAAMALGSAEGSCGMHTTWTLSFSGDLAIGGTGDIKDYSRGINSDYRTHKTEIKSVSLGAGVTGIGSYAFQGMPSLTTVKMGDDVIRINNYAFADCPLLAEIKLPANLFYIGSNAFSNCTSLKSIIIPENVVGLNARTFEGCTALQTVEVRNKSCAISSNNTFPAGVTLVGYKGSTTQTYAEKNGFLFKEITESPTDQPTNPTNPTQPTTPTNDGTKCPLCGQTHEGFPGTLIGLIHRFLHAMLMLFGMRQAG